MKKKLADLNIGTKLILGFSIVILSAIMIGTTGMLALRHVYIDYMGILDEAVVLDHTVTETQLTFSEISRHVFYMGYVAQTPEEINDSYDNYQEMMAQVSSQGEKIKALMQIPPKEYLEQEKEAADELVGSIFDLIQQDYAELVDALRIAALNGDTDIIALMADVSVLSDLINRNLTLFSANIKQYNDLSMTAIKEDVKLVQITQLLTMAVMVVFSIAIAMLITHYIRTPIRQLTVSAKKIASGDIHAPIRGFADDEIGKLADSMANVRATFLQLAEEINQSYQNLESGNMHVHIDEDLFLGDYKKVVKSVNLNFKYLTGVLNDMRACVNAYAEGDFLQTMRRLPGDQASVHKEIDYLRDNLMHVEKDIRTLMAAIKEGNLSVHIDEEMYHGDWKKVTASLNDLVETVEIPLQEVSAVLSKVALGDFSMRITGSYKGCFAKMSNAVNKTVDIINTYILDIAHVLDKMSNKDLAIEHTEDYIGDFKAIQDALLHIVSTFNSLLYEFSSSAGQVAASANKISLSSVTLAQGATAQTGSLDKVFQTLNSIKDQTKSNAQNAASANQLFEQTLQQSEENKIKMKKMLDYMETVLEDSSNTVNIIQTIDAIALQTNLLAINATIEAARAGSNGKGFTVVAEEVRELANKSQLAASETADLLQKTIDQISDGTRLAKETWISLNSMINLITEAGVLISDVSYSSEANHENINSIADNFNTIHQIIKSNTSMAVEYASASQELFSQAEVFKNSLSKFKLKSALS